MAIKAGLSGHRGAGAFSRTRRSRSRRSRSWHRRSGYLAWVDRPTVIHTPQRAGMGQAISTLTLRNLLVPENTGNGARQSRVRCRSKWHRPPYPASTPSRSSPTMRRSLRRPGIVDLHAKFGEAETDGLLNGSPPCEHRSERRLHHRGETRCEPFCHPPPRPPVQHLAVRGRRRPIG